MCQLREKWCSHPSTELTVDGVGICKDCISTFSYTKCKKCGRYASIQQHIGDLCRQCAITHEESVEIISSWDNEHSKELVIRSLVNGTFEGDLLKGARERIFRSSRNEVLQWAQLKVNGNHPLQYVFTDIEVGRCLSDRFRTRGTSYAASAATICPICKERFTVSGRVQIWESSARSGGSMYGGDYRDGEPKLDGGSQRHKDFKPSSFTCPGCKTA